MCCPSGSMLDSPAGEGEVWTPLTIGSRLSTRPVACAAAPTPKMALARVRDHMNEVLSAWHGVTRPCCHRSPKAQTIFVNRSAPKAIRDALRHQSWEKSSFDVKALIGKTQVVWVYDAVCKLSGETVALKCYRKELQSAINYQCATLVPPVCAIMTRTSIRKAL